MAFSKHWQQDEFSDIQVVIKAPRSTISNDPERAAKRMRIEAAGTAVEQDAEDTHSTAEMVVLSSFPSHKVLLSSWSDKFEAQMNFAGRQAQQQQQQRQQLEIELEDASHLAAAMAMFAAMYEVPGTIQQQDQPTLICMLVLAHQHDVPRVISAVQSRLRATGLKPDRLQSICRLPVLPPPLWPFLQAAVKQLLQIPTEAKKETALRLLLGVFGDLELVWAETDDTRRKLLCQLPYKQLALLLAADELQVATEDTVVLSLVNADAYQVSNEAKKPVQLQQLQRQEQLLLKLVRFPQLTAACLGTAVAEVPHVKEAFDLRKLLHFLYARGRPVVGLSIGGPPAWEAGPRKASSISSITMVYEAQVSELQHAVAQRAAAAQQAGKGGSPSSRTSVINCVWATPTQGSSVFAGRQWYVTWNASCGSGSTIKLSLEVSAVFGQVTPPKMLRLELPNPDEAYFPSAGLRVAVCGKPVALLVESWDCAERRKAMHAGKQAPLPAAVCTSVDAGESEAAKWVVPFCSMPGGWDAAVWAQQGLPEQGAVTVEVTVSVV